MNELEMRVQFHQISLEGSVLQRKTDSTNSRNTDNS